MTADANPRRIDPMKTGTTPRPMHQVPAGRAVFISEPVDGRGAMHFERAAVFIGDYNPPDVDTVRIEAEAHKSLDLMTDIIYEMCDCADGIAITSQRIGGSHAGWKAEFDGIAGHGGSISLALSRLRNRLAERRSDIV